MYDLWCWHRLTMTNEKCEWICFSRIAELRPVAGVTAVGSDLTVRQVICRQRGHGDFGEDSPPCLGAEGRSPLWPWSLRPNLRPVIDLPSVELFPEKPSDVSTCNQSLSLYSLGGETRVCHQNYESKWWFNRKSYVIHNQNRKCFGDNMI